MADRSQEARERQRDYSASYRAKKRAEAAERARTASDASHGDSREMRQAVDASLSAAKWLTGTDAASIAQARALANIVDQADDVRLQLRAHSLLSRVLGEIGLTPRVRTQMELRSRKLDTATAEAAIDGELNVTRFPRPTPRSR